MVTTPIAHALLLFATGATAQVPRVLGIWELDLAASDLPKGFPVRNSATA